MSPSLCRSLRALSPSNAAVALSKTATSILSIDSSPSRPVILTNGPKPRRGTNVSWASDGGGSRDVSFGPANRHLRVRILRRLSALPFPHRVLLLIFFLEERLLDFSVSSNQPFFGMSGTRGSNPCGSPHKPLVSYRINRQLSGSASEPPMNCRKRIRRCRASRDPVRVVVQIMTNPHGPLRVGVGGPGGSGKTALLAALCKALRG